MIIARFNYTETHALEASSQLTRTLFPWMRFLPLLGWLMVCANAYAWIFKGSAPWQEINPTIIGPFFCLLPWWTRRHVRKQFRTSPEAGHEHIWRIDNSTLVIETRGATSKFDWNMLIRVKEKKNGFLLFPQPRLAYWIPYSAFSSQSDIDILRGYIQQSSVPQKG